MLMMIGGVLLEGGSSPGRGSEWVLMMTGRLQLNIFVADK